MNEALKGYKVEGLQGYKVVLKFRVTTEKTVVFRRV